MATPSEVETEIEAAATQPMTAIVDGQQATSHPLPALIQADQYLARKRNARRRGVFGGIQIGVATPPGAVDRQC